ncbi:MAG: phosphatidate cytidylyltransferase [Williamsia sp.]|nr:phosphatidate cytidylyltransferase [Williamsia sp.]
MPFNVQTFKTRSLTAAVFVVVMLVGLLWNQWSFLVLFSIIHFGCWVEYQKLIGLIDPEYAGIAPFHKYGVMLTGWCLMLFAAGDAFYIGSVSLGSIGWWLGLISVFILPIIEFLFTREVSLKNIGYSVLGLLYISVSWAMMIDLLQSDLHSLWGHNASGSIVPLLIILSIWINDTMAYIVGSLIGKTPFSSISPKKTWEGTVGGAILCIAVVTLSLQSFISWKYLLAISAICAIVGTAGDLLESKLKRMAGVKDSGQIMPGHGGFLDRFDSLLLATPFVWMYLKLAAGL